MADKTSFDNEPDSSLTTAVTDRLYTALEQIVILVDRNPGKYRQAAVELLLPRCADLGVSVFRFGDRVRCFDQLSKDARPNLKLAGIAAIAHTKPAIRRV
jgi:hypothetical protein